MEQEPAYTVNDMSDMVVVDLVSTVQSELVAETNPSEEKHNLSDINQALFQTDEKEGEHDDDDSGTDTFISEKAGTQLQRCEQHGVGSCRLPDTFQTSNLLFYDRFKAYQDYMLGDCKPSEVTAFTADYLEKVLEPCNWLALWCTDVFDVLVEVEELDLKHLKACVRLVLPLQCHTRGCELTEEAMNSLLEATQYKIPLQNLQVVYDESGDLDQTALALEHLRFFYEHIWRRWDEEDEDDEFDYFVRCVEPRLRLYYDVLENRVPAGLVAEYQSLLENCSQCFQQFSELRNSLSADSDSELDNVSMVEGVKLCEQLETFKRKLHLIENPLLRYVLAYKGNSMQQSVHSRGLRASGMKVVHVVMASCSSIQLQSLLNARLMPLCSSEDVQIQFHSDPVSAVDACYQDDVVIVLPGTYSVSSSIFIPDSITIEGFGFPDEVVIEEKNQGDSFVESVGADVRLSNIKLIQHGAIEGILCVREGTLNMENCVLQCDTTGVMVRTSARLTMNMCDLYGSKGAGVEIYPGSVCSLVNNGIHHCKDGILIKDFASELDGMPSITLENNVIHNNEGFGVILIKLGEGQHGGVPVDGGDGEHGGVPADGGDGEHGGVPADGGDGEHGGVPGDGGEGQHGGVPADGGDGLHGGVPADGGEGQHGGVPADGGEGQHGGVPADGGDGLHGGVPADGGDGLHGGVPADGGDGLHGGVPADGGDGLHGGVPADGGEGQHGGVPADGGESEHADPQPVSSTSMKWQFARQLSRNKETTCIRAVRDLMEHQIFVSVQGNKFKRNGRGDFGTFSC